MIFKNVWKPCFWEAMVITTVVRICEIERRRTTEQRFKPVLRAVH